MGTTIFFNGRVTAIPGSYSEVDASGLAVVGLGANGIIACIGEAEGGKPLVVNRISNPGKVSRSYRDGDLREAGNVLFDPSKDPDIPAGAQEVKFVKVNPSTVSAITFPNADGDVMTVTSRDYGLFTTRINLEIAAGTNKGKAITITFDNTTEEFDDVGGDPAFTALYTPGATGADTMLMDLDNTVGVSADWTKGSLGLDSEITAAAPGAEMVQIESSAAGDTTQTATVYGTDGGGAAQTEVFALNGTMIVLGTATWTEVLGVILSAAAVGTVTLKSNPTTATTILTIAPAALTAGILLVDNVAVSTSTVAMILDAAGVHTVGFFGFNGLAAVGEAVATAGAVSADTTQVFTEITVIALGAVPAARTFTASGESFALALAIYETVSDMAGQINALDGWLITIGVNAGPLTIASLDNTAAGSVLGAKVFSADLAFIVEKLNNESQLVAAEVVALATGAPDNTTAPVFLVGGIEGVTTFTQWQAALDLIRDEFVNTVVPMTSDEAVHAATVSHCAFMGGPGRKERDCILGAASGETKAQIKARAVALNTRHARLVPQDPVRFNVGGQREQFSPAFMACIAAGMQSGSPVGESLTFKYLNVLDVVGNDGSYNLQDDGNELIQGGLCVVDKVQGIGFRWLRNVTTHLIDNNLAFIEASVNEAVNFATFNIRTNLEAAVGKKGFAGTVNAAASIVIKTMGQLTDPNVLAVVAWRNLTIEIENDVMTVDIELAPVIPVNFVKTTIHLVTASFSAAA